jgi:hypothetical protein
MRPNLKLMIVVGLASLGIAFVDDELKLERLLRVLNPRNGDHRNRESAIAKRADSDCGDLTMPFDNPEVSISHDQQFPTTLD